MAEIPGDLTRPPALYVPQHYYVVTTAPARTAVVGGRARRLVIGRVLPGGAVTLERVDGSSVVFSTDLLRAHATGVAAEGYFGATIDCEFVAWSAMNCDTFLVGL
jgi:hypothetical protein